MASNYPEDMHLYKHDPRSPDFEDDPQCDDCGTYLKTGLDADCQPYAECPHCAALARNLCPKCGCDLVIYLEDGRTECVDCGYEVPTKLLRFELKNKHAA